MGLRLTKLGRASFFTGIMKAYFTSTNSEKTVTFSWTDINGTNHDKLTSNYTNSPIYPTGHIYACSDIEADFVYDKSSYTQISSVATSVSIPEPSNVGDKMFRPYQITMSNSADNPVDVASLSFDQSFRYNTAAAQYSANGLTFMYYFKNPITIPANSSVNIMFNYGIDLSENL